MFSQPSHSPAPQSFELGEIEQETDDSQLIALRDDTRSIPDPGQLGHTLTDYSLCRHLSNAL